MRHLRNETKAQREKRGTNQKWTLPTEHRDGDRRVGRGDGDGTNADPYAEESTESCRAAESPHPTAEARTTLC